MLHGRAAFWFPESHSRGRCVGGAGGGGEEGWLFTTARASSDVSESYHSMYREYAVYDWKRISILVLFSSRLSISV